MRALPDAMVYSAGSAVREDASDAGHLGVPAGAAASGETVVIDTGFVENTMQDRSVEDRAVAKLVTGEPVALTGYLRFPEKRRHAHARAEPRQAALVRARSSRDGENARLGSKVAPFYIDLETPVPQNGIPKPGPLQVHLKDDHLQYAITWFTLAFAVAIAFAVWWRRRPRA